MDNVVRYYDALAEEGNDPEYDPEPLKRYMDKWDGQAFIEELLIRHPKTVLEIGVGTGRLAVRVAPFCRKFVGIDISPKTVERAKKNLKELSNVEIVCRDFVEYQSDIKFDAIYSSLTFLHIQDKKAALEKVKYMLNREGRFVLSIDKNQNSTIDYGTRKITVFPDRPDDMLKILTQLGMKVLKQFETEFAYIFVVGV